MATKRRVQRPKREFSHIIQTGIKAQDLAAKHKAGIEPRLPNGLLANLVTDVTTLSAQIPGAKQAHVTAHVATASQKVILEQGHALVTAVRLSVARSQAPADVRKAYGVGLKTNPRVVKDVKVGIQRILQRAGEQPAEASDAGILAKDLDALKTTLAAIESADEGQEKQRAAAPVSTLERNRTARRVIAAIDRIAAAGALEFATNPEERALFEGLIGAGNPYSKAKPEAVPATAPSI